MSDQPTKAQLEGEVKTVQAELAEATKSHGDAIASMERARGDKSVSMEALVELADAIRAAKATVDRKAASISTLNRRIANYDIIAKADERNGYVGQVHDGVKAMFSDDFLGAFKATGVDRLTIVVELTDGTVSVRPTGERLAGASARSAGSGNGRGFSSAGKVTVDGTEYASLNRAYVALRSAADGIDPAEVTPANSKSAEAWLTKNGHAITA